MSEKYAHPFIVPGSQDGTAQRIDTVLHMLCMHVWGLEEIHNHSIPSDVGHFAGISAVLEGVRTAVQFVNEGESHTETGGNVAQIPSAD